MTQSPSLQFKMRIAVEFDAPLAIVDGPLWTRRILHVASGKFDGPELRGNVLSGGGDWVLVRRDGSAELDIRFALKTVEDELVYFRSTGLFVASDAVAMRIRSGEHVMSIISGPQSCSRPHRKDWAISTTPCTLAWGKEQLPG